VQLLGEGLPVLEDFGGEVEDELRRGHAPRSDRIGAVIGGHERRDRLPRQQEAEGRAYLRRLVVLQQAGAELLVGRPVLGWSAAASVWTGRSLR